MLIIFLTWTDATERRAFRALSLSVQAETEANSGRARSRRAKATSSAWVEEEQGEIAAESTFRGQFEINFDAAPRARGDSIEAEERAPWTAGTAGQLHIHA